MTPSAKSEALAQTAVGLVVTLRTVPDDVTADGAPVGSDLLGVHDVLRHNFADHGAQPGGVNGPAAAGSGLRRVGFLGQPIMFCRPALTPRFNLVAAVVHGGSQSLDQQTQPDGDVALDIAVGKEVLVHHVVFDRGLTHGHDSGMPRAGLGWIPGGAAAGEDDQVRMLEVPLRLAAQVQRMPLREIGVQRRALHHWDGEQFGQGHQVVEALYLAPRAVGDDERRFAAGNQIGQLGNVLVRRADFRR